jgi:hypothetical protein
MTSIWSERRAHPRYPLGATLTFTYTGQLRPGSVHDLGKGGLSFWAEGDMPVGENLILTLTLIVGETQAKLSCRGEIRWKQPAEDNLFRYGLAFGALNPAQLTVLTEFLGGTGKPPVKDSRQL